jgi:pyrroline-5-carboxylate reductase
MIGFIGAGKMAEAILAGLLRNGAQAAQDIGVSDVQSTRLDALVAQYGIRAFGSNRALAQACDPVVLAVKPQELQAVLTEIAPFTENRCVISIAAGRLLAGLEMFLPNARVIRVMPNLACSVGEGMSVICGGKHVKEDDFGLAEAIFAASGKVCRAPESAFDMVTAVSGSGPAFWAQLAQYELAKAIDAGLEAETARLLILQTMLGTARVLMDGHLDLDVFMQAVASKGGTTAAGLEVLRQSPVADILGDVLDAAAQRSRELSKS